MSKKKSDAVSPEDTITIAEAEAALAAFDAAEAAAVETGPAAVDAPPAEAEPRVNPSTVPEGYVPITYPLVVRKDGDEKLVHDAESHDVAKAEGWA